METKSRESVIVLFISGFTAGFVIVLILTCCTPGYKRVDLRKETERCGSTFTTETELWLSIRVCAS